MSDAALKATQEALRATGAELKKATDENTRLRAELSDMTENRNILRKWHGQAANAAESAEATISRVRSVLDAADLSDRETGFYMDIRAALNKKED